MAPRKTAVFAFTTIIVFVALGVTSPRLVSADPIRIEVQPLANTSALTANDVEVLDALVMSEMSALPQDRFDVVAAPVADDAACDPQCRSLQSGARGAQRIVIGSIAEFGDGFVGSLGLYDAQTGQLIDNATTGVVTDAPALFGGLKKAVAELREKLQPAPPTITPPPAVPVSPPVVPMSNEATLRVDTIPPGANVFIRRVGHTEFVGTAPLEKILLPVEYNVIVQLADYRPASTDVRLDPHETETVRFTLDRIFPMSPYKKLGHALFWPGLVGVGFGFVFMSNAQEEAARYRQTLDTSAQESSRNMVGGMWASFGVGTALAITGIVLWAATPSSREHWEKSHGAAALAPTPDSGFVMAYGRRF